MSSCLRCTLACVSAIVIVTMLAGCGPERLVQWSPDGTRAVVLSNNRLYLCEAEGKLAGPMSGQVERFVWLPDSRRVVAVFTREIESWDALVQTAPAEFDEKRIIAAAIVARDELIGYSGKLDDFKPSNSSALTAQQWMAGILYLRSQADSRLKEKLGKDWKEVEEAKVEVRTVRLMPASDPGEGGITLLDTLDDIDDLRVAPGGGTLAVVARRGEGWDESENRMLFVVQTGPGGKPFVAAEHIASHPDWSADGRDLVFVRQGDKDSGGLGRLAVRTIRDNKGAMLETLPEARDLAEVVFDKELRVRCLRDGRVLFAAAELSLPATVSGSSHRPVLFVLDTAGTPGLKRAFPAAVDARVPDRVDLFEVSPDETRMAIPGSKGRVAVVSLSTGEVREIITNNTQDDLRMVPVWRSPDQLCLLAPTGSAFASPKRDEIVLWSTDRVTVLSRTWPDEVVAGIK
jgi:hypothetical protein